MKNPPPLIPDDRILEIIRGYVVSNSEDLTRPDMNREVHQLSLCRVIVDEATARIPLWQLELLSKAKD